MAVSDRQKEIIEYLTQHNGASVTKLAEVVHASTPTIRRDLTALEQTGKLRRTFGGAVIDFLPNRDEPLMFREQSHLREKNIIAAKAIRLISDGDTVFLDASSTVSRLVPLLDQFHNLTIVTNSPRISLALGTMNIKNYCSGGELIPDSSAYVGASAVEFFGHFNADTVFFSSRGISPEGWICDSSIDETTLRRGIFPFAKKKIMLCDSNKLNHTYRCNLCRISDVDMIITELDETDENYPEILISHKK